MYGLVITYSKGTFVRMVGGRNKVPLNSKEKLLYRSL